MKQSKRMVVALILSIFLNVVLGYVCRYEASLLWGWQTYNDSVFENTYRSFCSELNVDYEDEDMDIYYAEQAMRMSLCYNIFQRTSYSENGDLQYVIGYLRAFCKESVMHEKLYEELVDNIRELSIFPDNEELASRTLVLLRELSDE